MIKFFLGKKKILKILNKKEQTDKNFTRLRCPKCNALLFEKDLNSYAEGSIRIKCRLCKEIFVL